MKKSISKLAALAALAAFSVLAQTAPEKPKEIAKVTTVAKEQAPKIDTAKLWRLVVASQNAHKALDESQPGQVAKAADEAVQKEQTALAAKCGEHFVLGYDQDEKSATFQDIVCVARPPAPPPAETKKEK